MKLTHARAVALMVLVGLLWSTAGVVTRHLESAQRFEITFWRSLFTLISLLIILPLLQGRTVFTAIGRGNALLWASGLCWCIMFTAFMVAITLTSVANVLITMALSPLLTAVLARIFIGERIAPRTWLAIALAGVGMAWMFGSTMSLAGGLAGTLVALMVPLASACNWTVVQFSRSHGQKIDLIPAVMIGALLSALATLPFALPFSASARDLGWLAGLGLFQLAIPCVLAVLCGSVLKAPEIALLGLLEVIFGILLVWIGAGEAPAAQVLTGGALVIGALVLNELIGWKQQV